MTQILAVDKDNQSSVVVTPEKAIRIETARPDTFAFFELRFGKSPRPVLKPITVKKKEVKVPEVSLESADGDVIE